MQVDHLIPRLGGRRPSAEVPVNLMPSCRRCNHYKRSRSLKKFRRLLITLDRRIKANYVNKVAIDYGVIGKVVPWDGVFYFEKDKIGRNGSGITSDKREPIKWTQVKEDHRLITIDVNGRATVWLNTPEDLLRQKMEKALRAILIEATRVERGNFVSLLDDLSRIRDIAYEGLEGSNTRR